MCISFNPLQDSGLFPKGKVKIWLLSSCCQIWQTLWVTLLAGRTEVFHRQNNKAGLWSRGCSKHREDAVRKGCAVGALEVSLGCKCPCTTDTSIGAWAPPCCAPASHPPLGTCSPSCPRWPKPFSLHPSFSLPCSSLTWSGTLAGMGTVAVSECRQAALGGWSQHQALGSQVLQSPDEHLCVHVCVRSWQL